MGLLNHLFGSTESTAKEIELDNESILENWRNYLKTIPKKEKVIGELARDINSRSKILKLNELLNLDLVDISNEEIKKSELISDLELIEHSQKIKRLHKLEQCLRNIETKYEYVSALLYRLHSVLKAQMHLIKKLVASSKDAERLIFRIKLQFELELEIIEKIKQIKTFHNLFLALIRGEHIIRQMNFGEKKLLKRMQKTFSKVFAEQITDGLIYKWAMTVFNEVQYVVEDHEAILASGDYPHENVDFQLVNGPKFLVLVRRTIQNLKIKVTEQMVAVFIHSFREWYNYERG